VRHETSLPDPGSDPRVKGGTKIILYKAFIGKELFGVFPERRHVVDTAKGIQEVKDFYRRISLEEVTVEVEEVKE
jgi:hypothetical protein